MWNQAKSGSVLEKIRMKGSFKSGGSVRHHSKVDDLEKDSPSDEWPRSNKGKNACDERGKTPTDFGK